MTKDSVKSFVNLLLDILGISELICKSRHKKEHVPYPIGYSGEYMFYCKSCRRAFYVKR